MLISTLKVLNFSIRIFQMVVGLIRYDYQLNHLLKKANKIVPNQTAPRGAV